jgi:menaquinone-dependent protoporphyrinogen oxidase
MKMRTCFAPTEELLVPGAVRISEYDFFAMQVVRYVVLRNRDYDPGEGTHEFTDWNALSEKLESFLA